MSAQRLLSITVLFGVAVTLAARSTAAAAQDVSVQQLLERGALDEAIQRAEAERDNPESTYLAAQALIKKDDGGRAGEAYGRLRERSDEDWKAIGESGAALLGGTTMARWPPPNVQLPRTAPIRTRIIRSARSPSGKRISSAPPRRYGRSVELKPDLAYAHYYAGIAYQRVRQIPKMSEHLETFLRLAPDAPERTAVAAILRTLRGRAR